MAKKKTNIDMRTKKGSKLFVVDANAVMYTNYVPLSDEEDGDKFDPYNKFKKRELSYEVDGEKFNTSALYGLIRLMKTHGMNSDYVFCFDTPYNDRKKEDATYKAGRAKKPDDLIDQMNVAYDMLESAGYPVHKYSGYEADDFVVEAVNQNKSVYDHVFVVTNDFDMAQNVDDNVYLKNVVKKRGDITKENYEEMVGCPYNSILLYKSMVGDKSDNFKGIYRFGPKKFYQFLEDEGIYRDLPYIRKRKNGELNILRNTGFLNEEQRTEAIKSLYKALPRFPEGYGSMGVRQSIDKELFAIYLEKYGMYSIIKEL